MDFVCDRCLRHYRNGTMVRVDNETVCWRCYKKGRATQTRAGVILRVFEEEYVRTGYMYSGCMGPNNGNLREMIVTLDELFNLVDKGKLQRRQCKALSFELPPERRKELILQHELAIVWERVAPYFYPNDPNYGEVSRVLAEGQ